ncbi:MAG: protein kinase, partial [Planctomycetales bacterium]|nr:protein kinase [Planctomycetales bacterium]
MKTNRSTCDEQRLAAFLDERTTPDEQAWLESHLETCFACRQRLHQAAGDRDSWEDAARLLRDEPFDAEPLSGWSESAESDDVAGDVDSDWATQHAAVASDGTQRVLDALAPTDDPRMLGRLGGYEILGVIGAGGMGVVLKGFDASLNRYVAIKVLAPHLANHGAARRRFSREAQAAAAVVHPHVVAIHAVSAEARPPFLVMPYLRGMSLQRRIDEHGPLSVAEVLRIGAQTASGLAAA